MSKAKRQELQQPVFSGPGCQHCCNKSVLTFPPCGVPLTMPGVCREGPLAKPRSHLYPSPPEQEVGHCIFITFLVAGRGWDAGQHKKGQCLPRVEGFRIFPE